MGKKAEEDRFKITPRKQEKRGPREDHSMIKLGKMLGEHGGLTPDKYNQVKGSYRPRDGRPQREVVDERTSPGPRRKASGDQRDIKVQQQVSVMIQKSGVRVDSKSFHHHTEHIIMIRLGKLQMAGNLTFERYTKMKTPHRIQMAEHVRYREIDMYDNDADVFARVDEAVTKHPIIVKLSMSGDKPRMAEQDKVIQVVVTQMLQETHVPVTERDFKYHMEQMVLIRLGNLLKAGQLTFHKYNSIKQHHLQDIKDALRYGEIDSYDWITDIFTRLDFHIGIKVERVSEVDPMVVVGPEEDYGDQERKEREKARDQFAERERKTKEEEKIVIKPANLKKSGAAELTVEGPEDEEDLGDQERQQRDKVRDEFSERQRKTKEDEKIIIKPADISLRGKKDGDDEEEEEDLGDQELQKRDKVRDEFAKRQRKTKEEEKIIIKPADISLRGKKDGDDEEEEDLGDQEPQKRDKV